MSAINKVLYYIVFSIWYVFSLLPMCIHYFFSDCMYFLVYYIIRYRRTIVRKNLVECFPEKSIKDIIKIEKEFYSFFCDFIVETIKLISISKENILRRMEFEGVEMIKNDLEKGQFVSLYSGHYGNWEWISCMTFHLGMENKCSEIYHALQNPVFDKIFLHIRERFGSTGIEMKESYRTILGWYKEKKPAMVGYIADQVPPYSGMHYWTDFLNHDTPVFSGAERITRMTDASVYYLEISRKKRGYYKAKFTKIVADPKELPKFGITEQYFRLLEDTIMRNPPYWLWSHNRWKRDREGFNRAFSEEERKKILGRL